MALTIYDSKYRKHVDPVWHGNNYLISKTLFQNHRGNDYPYSMQRRSKTYNQPIQSATMLGSSSSPLGFDSLFFSNKPNRKHEPQDSIVSSSSGYGYYCDNGINIALLITTLAGIAVMFYVLYTKLTMQAGRRKKKEAEFSVEEHISMLFAGMISGMIPKLTNHEQFYISSRIYQHSLPFTIWVDYYTQCNPHHHPFSYESRFYLCIKLHFHKNSNYVFLSI